MYKKIAGLVLAAALLCESLAAQYSTKIDVLKGEQWWGVFVGGEQAMPLSEPFPQTDLSTWVKSNARRSSRMTALHYLKTITRFFLRT